jgi:hypothetical protein
MARRGSAALARAEKAVAGARKRAAVIRQKIKKDQPMEIAVTIGGGALDGAIQSQTPQFLRDIDVDPGLAVGGLLIGYGLLSTRDGQAEKISTLLGTGVMAATVSRIVSDNMS